jgi:SAM-dependent methyltransferase
MAPLGGSAHVPCPVCGQMVAAFVSALDQNRRTSDEVFTYYRCSSCRFVFLFPIPLELGRFYPRSYYATPSLAEVVRGARREQFKIDIVRNFSTRGRLVEVGPGDGAFVYLAKMAGFQVEAVEIDAEVCRWLAEVVEVRTIRAESTLVALDTLPPYDVIAFWHSLEHIPGWEEILDAVARRLRPGGICVIAMPNPDAFQFRVFKDHWAHLDAPRHVQLIPVALLDRKMQSVGLCQEWFTTTDSGSVGYNGFGWGMSLKSYFASKPIRFAMYLIGRIVATLLKPIEMTGLRGSCYTIVFRKE